MSGGGLRQLLLQQITEDEQMGGMLASYNKAPAAFYQKAPSDSRPRSEERRVGKECYS